VSTDYHVALRVNAIAVLFIAIWFIARRTRLILLQDQDTAMGAPMPAAADTDGKPMVAGIE